MATDLKEVEVLGGSVILTNLMRNYRDAHIYADKRQASLVTNTKVEELMTDYLAQLELQKRLPVSITDSWVFYPRSFTPFKTDEWGNIPGGNSILAGSSIPKGALGESGVAIAYDNPKVVLGSDGTYLISEGLEPGKVLRGFPQASGWTGVDDETNLPAGNGAYRYVFRNVEQTGLPVVRVTHSPNPKHWRFIFLDANIDSLFSVALSKAKRDAS